MYVCSVNKNDDILEYVTRMLYEETASVQSKHIAARQGTVFAQYFF